MRPAMLIAKPAPEEKIRDLASGIALARPGVSVDSFLLPRSEACNDRWNTQATSNTALRLEWYLDVIAASRGFDVKDPKVRQYLAEEALEDILGGQDYTVIVENERVPLTLDYLMQRDNWISNAAAIAFVTATSKQLGPEYSDIEAVTSPNNPWIEQAKFALAGSAQVMGLVLRVAKLKDGPRQVYLDIPLDSALLVRNKLYEIVEDVPIGPRRRRVVYMVHWTNYYTVVPEIIGWNHAVFVCIPLLFSEHPLLRHIPGFNLGPADVHIEYPDGDYAGTWVVSVEYGITPIDRVRSWFNVGELQETVATLSAEVLELQRDRKALSEEAEQLAGQLIEAEKLAAVGRLSFGVGHDLRNTLATAINSGIPLSRLMADLQQVMDMLDQEKPLEEIAEYMSRRRIHLRLGNAPDLYETIMNSLAQALENVKSLEGYAVQDGSGFQEVRIEEVIERVLRDHRKELGEIRLETFYEAREYTFLGNTLKIYDIFQNLVVNAIEAMEAAEKPVLRITTGVSDGMHRTVVEDNGCGMSEEVMKHAFEPFFTTRDLVEGRQRGMGLFNIWRLVEQHSGTVEVKGERDQFTKFSVDLPVKA